MRSSPAHRHETSQPGTGSVPPFRTVTVATKPPPHLLSIVAVAEQSDSVRAGPPITYGSRVPLVSPNRNQYSVPGARPPMVTVPDRSGPVTASATGSRHAVASSRLAKRLMRSGGS